MTRSALNRIIALALALPVVVALTLAGLVLWMAQTPMTDAVHDYRIGKGTGFQGLAEDLHSRSYISSPELLRVYRWWRRTGKPVQMGDYRISAGMLPGEFLDMIEQGRVVSYDFSIIPGSTVGQILGKLRALSNIRHTLPDDISPADLMARIGADAHKNRHAEGMFYADTYHYHAGSADVDLLRRAHRLLLKKLDEHCNVHPDVIGSPYEALVLASIVEKESGSMAEHAVIAGVFLNRLNRKMRLEADPTVIYGLGSRYQGDIKTIHLRTDTAYNTYTRSGLPPTPIASVWQHSLIGVCQPVSHDYLFFVADGRGGHEFNVDYEGHRQAVRRYINFQKNR
ncbi:MAG: endolytic transglycosylase MltG [Gammaproteobacteria bacterium]|nr:endolytic transglycosylase MltG [Gammaproteobacteria bacterium]